MTLTKPMIKTYLQILLAALFATELSCSSEFYKKTITKEYLEEYVLKTKLPPSSDSYFKSIASSGMDPEVISVFHADKIEDIDFFIKKIGYEEELNSEKCLIQKTKFSPEWWSPCQGGFFLSSEWTKNQIGSKIVVEKNKNHYIVYFLYFKT